MADILLSIHPVYTDRIFDGSKRYEYRKRLPSQTVERVVIYSSSPVCRIVGEFTVSEVVSKSTEELWQETRYVAGIHRVDFFNYFTGRDVAHAFKIGEVTRYSEPVDPRAVGPYFAAPQSFVYLDSISTKVQRAIVEARW